MSIDALGFRTSGRQLIAATESRTDVIAVHALVPPPVWMKVLNHSIPGVADHGVHPARTWRWLVRRWLRGPLDGCRFDVVHANPQMVAWGAAEAKERFGYRLSVACDTTERQFVRELTARKRPRRVEHGEAATFAAADLIAPLSRWCERSLVNDYGIDSARILITPPTVAVPRDLPVRAPNARPLRLAFVGNDFARKGGPRLFRWHQDRWADRGVEMHFVGADAEPRPGRLVTWHGGLPHDRVLALLATCDLLVHPTSGDMSPLVIAEAATLGVPAVASRLAGIPDLVRDGETGLLVPPPDDASFVAAVERLLFDDALRRQFSDRARAFARNELNTTVVYGRLIDRLVGLAASSGPA
ncbi:MAG: glycosyltransferase family 4 protein [Tepidisphaeraceae bacterium]